MEYIERSPAPTRLVDNQEKWTQPWFDYYLVGPHKKRPKKPSDSHWTDNNIRNVLIADFKNNCGYCGVSRPTPRRAPGKSVAPRGHVDHYRAKAIYPELTYEWANYIWSCEACNVEKGEFDEPQHPILNPCDITDCDQLNFVEDCGVYVIDQDNQPYQKRFNHTDKMTMMNSNEISKDRSDHIKLLRSSFVSIQRFIPFVNLDAAQEQIRDSCSLIFNALENPKFYLLVRKNYKSLREQYPDVAAFLDDR